MKMNVQKVFQFVFLTFFLFFAVIQVFADDGKSVIRIERAQKSEYRKDKEGDTDLIVLTGDVRVSVEKNGKTTTITADRVNFNRAKDMIYAEGGVVLEKGASGGEAGERVEAKSLLFNTATLEGIFDDGRAVQTSSDALNLPSGSKLIVDSDVFARDSDGTIAFKSGDLTFCDDDDPHWKIRATRIWLLPGGEFAFLNAVLFVGRVPLMWLPAFYYPKDELLFNPTFGYKARTGYFFNTTTYIYGRKAKRETSSSDDSKIDFFSLMNTNTLKKQRREGLVLHNLNENYSGDTEHYAKIMADYYANLGVMAGFDANLSPGDSLTSLLLNAQVGFSNTVFKSGGAYFPYNKNGDVVRDEANFMSFEAPFRFQGNISMTFARPFSLTLKLPVYSDPYFVYDFADRTETMDWISYAMNGGSSDDDDDDDVTESPTSFTWSLDGSYSVPISDSLKPYLNSVSISSVSSSVVYSSKANERLDERDEYNDDSGWKTYTPSRKFYYPSQVTPFKIGTSVSGTILKIPADRNPQKTPEHAAIPKIDEFKTEDELEVGDRSQEIEERNEDSESSGENEKRVFKAEDMPQLNSGSFSTVPMSDLKYSLGYSVSPAFSSQFSYSSTALKSPEDFEWGDMQSTYVQMSSPATLTSSLGYRDGFLSLTDSFTFSPAYQKHPYLKEAETDENGNESTANGGYSESSIKSIRNSDYAARKLDLTNTNTLSVKPFYYTEHFSGTALTWNSTMKMIDTQYVSDDPDEPEWEYLTMDFWDKDEFTTHTLSATLAVTEFDRKFSQSLTLTSNLHPQPDKYTGTLSLGFPYVTLSASAGIYENQTEQTDSNADYWEKWVRNDFSETLSVSLFSGNLKLSQSYAYAFEDSTKDGEPHPSSLRFSLSGYGAQLSYTASYVSGYEFDVVRADDDSDKIVKRNGWKVSSDDKEFQPYQLSLAYTNSSRTYRYWTDRISFAPTISTSVVYDYLRPTSSYLVFKPGITFKVNDFLDLSFSVESRNSAIYRYFCPDDKYEFYYGSNGERNILTDLKNSFRFDDDDIRKSSAFKVKSISVSASHDLDDWDLNCSFSFAPKYDSTAKQYDFSPYFSLSVSWRPMPSMKAEIVDDYGEWELNP